MLVVAYHAFLFTGHTGDAAEAMPLWELVIGMGYIGVAVFIVLSGYVLMLPVTMTPDLTFRGGMGRFFKRRARRILPPYYAALLFGLLLIFLVPVMSQPADTAWDSKLPVTIGGLVSHLLLVQDFSPEWIFQINGPLWSVAVEWQIYFVMALALLPLWRRIPAPAIVSVLLVVTVASDFLNIGAFIHPWFVALFACGMWAAQLTFSVRAPKRLGLLVLATAAVSVALMLGTKVVGLPTTAIAETTAGITVALALVWLGRREVAGRPAAISRFFRARPMMFLGLISYSVYLFHSPILALGNLLLLPLGLPTVVQYLVMTFACIPVAVFVSWLMFLLVERHFLNTRQKHATTELAEQRPATHTEDAAAPSETSDTRA
ncbi:Acyltransferase family protein [Microbacterium trichothecenolyticum]|uniref:Acyltransferase family protein n=2 Tax=Microbacterium trichothecenolyticum TaxID=69370 RepID=A0A0M2H7H9_MICTR|nr:Acyltransferase family protein [Microbacterium trichothecenolyticum]